MLIASIQDPRLQRIVTNSANLLNVINNTWEHLLVFNGNKELIYNSYVNHPNLSLPSLNSSDFFAMIDPEHREGFINNLEPSLKTTASTSFEYVWRMYPDKQIWVQASFYYVEDQEIHDIFILVFCKEISRLKQYEAYLKSMAYNDPLTNLPNRRSLEEHYHHTVAFAKRYKLQFGVVYMDVDDFKSINDQYGHAAGDEYLKHVSTTVAQCLRESDILARIGGDEFVIILTNTPSITGIDTVIMRIYNKLEQGIKLVGNKVNISLSIGAAVYPEHGDTLEKLLQSADTALYQAKKESKNTYYIFNDTTH